MDIALKDKLVDFFQAQENLIFAYIFGSQVSGKTGKLSDIDVAVYLTAPGNINLFDTRLKLAGDLSDFLKTDKVDMVILNDAPPLLVYRILQTGKVIFSRDEAKRLDYEVKAGLNYLDWKFYLDKYAREKFPS